MTTPLPTSPRNKTKISKYPVSKAMKKAAEDTALEEEQSNMIPSTDNDDNVDKRNKF